MNNHLQHVITSAAALVVIVLVLHVLESLMAVTRTVGA